MRDIDLDHQVGIGDLFGVLTNCHSSLCDVLTPQIIPDKSTKYISMFEVVRTFFFFLYQFFQNARRGRARVGALAWVRVRARVGRRPLAI